MDSKAARAQSAEYIQRSDGSELRTKGLRQQRFWVIDRAIRGMKVTIKANNKDRKGMLTEKERNERLLLGTYLLVLKYHHVVRRN